MVVLQNRDGSQDDAPPVDTAGRPSGAEIRGRPWNSFREAVDFVRSGFCAQPSPSLARQPDCPENGAMRGHTVRRHIVTYRFIATLCVCWLAYCGAPRSNVLPLAFGMTVGEASAALGEPLLYHSGRRGS